MVDAEKFWRDGYLVLPSFFDRAEVLRWRSRALERGPQLADLLSDDILREIVLDRRVLSTARELLDDPPVYFCDSTAAIGAVGWGFHKDNTDRTNGAGPDWKVERYPIVRFGIYCQPHGRLSDGLDLRRGSHMHADYDSGPMVSPHLEPGDLIVWTGRTTHSANSAILRGLGIRIEPKPTGFLFRAFNRLPRNLVFRPHPETRVALFASFGREHPLLDRHIEYLKQRAYPWDVWRESHWTEETRAMAEDRGLELIDLTSEQYDGREIHESYHPLPY